MFVFLVREVVQIGHWSGKAASWLRRRAMLQPCYQMLPRGKLGSDVDAGCSICRIILVGKVGLGTSACQEPPSGPRYHRLVSQRPAPRRKRGPMSDLLTSVVISDRRPACVFCGLLACSKHARVANPRCGPNVELELRWRSILRPAVRACSAK